MVWNTKNNSLVRGQLTDGFLDVANEMRLKQCSSQKSESLEECNLRTANINELTDIRSLHNVLPSTS